MHSIDWAVIGGYAVLALVFALWFARRRRGAHTGEEYMVAGRTLPWWMVGIADVATADGADAFWVYVFFLGGFVGFHRFFWVSAIIAYPLGIVWARYWRRLRLASAGQIYEERYGGRAAGGFRATFAVWGALVNTGIVLAYVLKGFAQSLLPFLGFRGLYIGKMMIVSPSDEVLLLFVGVTLLYTTLSGLLAVAYTDVAQFVLMMSGRILLAVVAVGAAGGLGAVLDRVDAVRGLDFLQPYPPATGALYGKFEIDPLSLVALLLVGFFGVAGTQSATVQKSLAAKNELHAAAGQMFGTFLSLVLRVVPMMLVGLVAIATLGPGRTDTDLWADVVRAYVPPGMVGLLLVGIVAGYMSTLDGFLSFSASGILNDVYRRYVRPNATDKEQVAFGRMATVAVMLVAYLWARVLIESVNEDWINFINSVTGLFMLPLALLRWTWWRMNIWGEVVGFVGAFPLAYAVWFGVDGWIPAFKDRPYWQSFAVLVGLGWGLILAVTWLTRPESQETLKRFYLKARPPGLWGPVAKASGLDATERRARGRELHHDLLTAVVGVAFTGGIVVALGAAFARRWGLLAGTAGLAALAAALFTRLTITGERMRARLGRSD